MDVLRWIVFGILPAIAVMLFGVGAGGPRLLAVSLATSICIAAGMLVGWPIWPWDLSLQHGEPRSWAWWSVLAAGVVGSCHDARVLPRVLTVPAEFAIVAALPWLLTGALRATWTFEQGVVWLLGAGALLLAIWWVLRRVASLQPGGAVVLAGAIALLADTLVLRARGHAWDVPAVAVVALGLALLTTVWRRPFVCGTGAALSITIAHAALLWGGHGERALLRPAMLLAAVAPLAMAVALAKAFAQGRQTGIVVGVVATAGVAVAAVALA